MTKQQLKSFRDPLAARQPLFGVDRIRRLGTTESPGNPAYSSTGDLFASIQSVGFGQRQRAVHLARWDAEVRDLVPFPDDAYQKRIGGLLGILVVPKPGALGGPSNGEVLAGLDWRKSEFFAIDLATNLEVFRAALPDLLLQRLIPPAKGALSFHNDLTVSFDTNPDGTFFISNPARSSVGVFRPNWLEPSKSRYVEVLRRSAATNSGKTPLLIGDQRMTARVLTLFGRDVNIAFRGGVDSICYAPRLSGKGPHLLMSPITPVGAANLWAMPTDVAETGDVEATTMAALREGRIWSLPPVPINDGMRVIELRGRPYLFGTDVAGSGVWVMDLHNLEVVSLFRDPDRIGWADGVALRLEGERLTVATCNSGTERLLRGEIPPVEQRGLYMLELQEGELFEGLPR